MALLPDLSMVFSSTPIRIVETISEEKHFAWVRLRYYTEEPAAIQLVLRQYSSAMEHEYWLLRQSLIRVVDGPILGEAISLIPKDTDLLLIQLEPVGQNPATQLFLPMERVKTFVQQTLYITPPIAEEVAINQGLTKFLSSLPDAAC